MKTPNNCLDEEVKMRVESLERHTVEEWGGIWKDGKGHVRLLEGMEEDYCDKTIVRSCREGVDAFKKYTDFFEYVLINGEANSDCAVMLPCGSKKPIGYSGIHRKKIEALRMAGFLPRCDLVIVSEPAGIVPHDMRLTLPPVNYDFPPKYAERERCPKVFDIFTDRIATWMESRNYSKIYPYLINRHQNKFDEALRKTTANPEVVEIPGSSLNPNNLDYSSDRMKTTEQIATKLDFVRGLKDLEDARHVSHYPEEVKNFYRNHRQYQQ